MKMFATNRLMLGLVLALVTSLLSTKAALAQGGDPLLIAEYDTSGQSVNCCLSSEFFVDRVGFNLFYGYTSSSGGDKAFGIAADLEVGGELTHFPGAIGFFDFDASNTPDFGAFVARLTDNVSEGLTRSVSALRVVNGDRGVGSYTGTGEEWAIFDGINRGSVDLAGFSVDFIRLLVNSVDITNTPVVACSFAPDCFQTTVDINAVWQFWQGDPSVMGGGQRSDVDTFLSFNNPLKKTVNTPAGINGFSVGIVYGPTIDPLSFDATLNGQPFSGFSPVSGTQEVVTIPLSTGRNVLKLSVVGIRSDGRFATDRDTLTFITP